MTSIPLLEDTLLSVFGYSSFREGQREIIQTIIDNQDVIGILPTGSGKSLCYMMYAMLTDRPVLVVSPLIALMEDQVLHLKKLNIPAACLHSQLTDDEFSGILSNIRNYKLIYVSPERVQTGFFIENILKPISFSLFVIDEVHCVSHWGHDFRKDYTQLGILRDIVPNVRIMALTASATPHVIRDVVLQLRLQKNRYKCLMYGFYRPNLFYRVTLVSNKDDKLSELYRIIQRQKTGRILIYCGTRQLCQDVASYIKIFDSKIGYYHAGMTHEDRRHIKESYDNGDIRILAATNAFGMGIDHPDVRIVVHFRMPSDLDHLYQEMGRAGRDGQPAECVLFWSTKDRSLQNYFILQSDHHDKGILYFRLRKLIEYAEQKQGCRHKSILDYYYQDEKISMSRLPNGRCGHCDLCTIPISPTLPSQKTTTIRSSVDSTLETNFKKWRQQESEKKKIPVYCVLTNQMIQDLVENRPQDIQQLSKIKGMGPKRLEKYSTQILKMLIGGGS